MFLTISKINTCIFTYNKLICDFNNVPSIWFLSYFLGFLFHFIGLSPPPSSLFESLVSPGKMDPLVVDMKGLSLRTWSATASDSGQY